MKTTRLFKSVSLIISIMLFCSLCVDAKAWSPDGGRLDTRTGDPTVGEGPEDIDLGIIPPLGEEFDPGYKPGILRYVREHTQYQLRFNSDYSPTTNTWHTSKSYIISFRTMQANGTYRNGFISSAESPRPYPFTPEGTELFAHDSLTYAKQFCANQISTLRSRGNVPAFVTYNGNVRNSTCNQIMQLTHL
jgi:hypothetical protein